MGKACAELFPAYAGVIPLQRLPALADRSFPRIRGGDPWALGARDYLKIFSPHTRG